MVCGNLCFPMKAARRSSERRGESQNATEGVRGRSRQLGYRGGATARGLLKTAGNSRHFHHFLKRLVASAPVFIAFS
jgi:hypothetical protein